jgi:hypothetical protein
MTRPTAGAGRSLLARRGLLLGAVQGLLLLSLAGTLLLERWQRPRAWGLVTPMDPQLPIRGRYISLQLAVPAPELPPQAPSLVRLVARNGRLLAQGAHRPGDSDLLAARLVEGPRGREAVLLEPLAFFLPPDAPDPSQANSDGPLWVEVILPQRGPPRPIRLGRQRNGAMVPLPQAISSW